MELLAKLGPTPPRRQKRSWWHGRGDHAEFGATEKERALVRVMTGEEEIAALTTPKVSYHHVTANWQQGIMLTGPPGTGKSLLLSLAFDAIPTPYKKRHHYHAFTLWLYQRVFAEIEAYKNSAPVARHESNMNKAGAKGWRAVFASGRWKEGADVDLSDQDPKLDDPRDTIPFRIAKEMILDYHILYFDELQLVDASSATLLKDVLGWYWRLGGVILFCSNRLPEDLYMNGVQRERMAGFLDGLRARSELVELDGGRDWRQAGGGEERWLGLEDGRFDDWWAKEGDGAGEPQTLGVYGRRVEIPAAKGSACKFTFGELCETPLGPADYITLSSTFRTFYLDEVPVLLLKSKNEARRLISLIDALYEARCKVVIRAAADPEHLFFPDAVDPSLDPDMFDPIAAESLSEALDAQPLANVSIYNPRTRTEQERDQMSDRGTAFAVSNIFTGEDERFAYKRAVSRLVEMSRSEAYQKEAWLPLDERAWEAFGAETAAAVREPRRGIFADPMQRSYGGKGMGPIARSRMHNDVIDSMAAESGAKAPGQQEEPIPPSPREGAPRIKEVHAWGVEDRWGPKAGDWGKGASVYDSDKKKE